MKRKFLFTMLMVCLGVLLFGVVSTSAETYGNYTYEKNRNEITIIGFNRLYKGAITIPDEIEGYPVTAIGEHAFEDCGLTSVKIPGSVKYIGMGAFAYCANLTEVTIGELTAKDDLILFAEDDTPPDVPTEELTNIGKGAFAECEVLKKVLLGKSVETIGSYVFYSCDVLMTVTLDKSLRQIGYSAFADCNNLQYVYYNGAEEDWVNVLLDAYNECLINAEFDFSVIRCGLEVFWDLSEEGVLTISGYGDMYDYNYDNKPWGDMLEKIKKIVIEEGVTAIGVNAFSGCINMTNVQIPDSVKTIGIYAFSDCTSLNSLKLSDSITQIGWAAFEDCSGLECVELPRLLTTIEDNLFWGCQSLVNIEIPGTVESIGQFAFYKCHSLEKLEIPDSVKTIGTYAFSECCGLENIYIGNSVVSIGDAAFHCCCNLTNVDVSKQNWYFVSCEGVLYDKQQTSLILYPAKKPEEAYEYPCSLKTVWSYAFYRCENLKHVYFNGTEKAWKKVWFSVPKNAVVHYACTDTTFETTELTYEFSVECENLLGSELLVVVCYDGEGRVISYDTVEHSRDSIYTASIPRDGNIRNAKVFLWSDCESFAPLGFAESIDVF